MSVVQARTIQTTYTKHNNMNTTMKNNMMALVDEMLNYGGKNGRISMNGLNIKDMAKTIDICIDQGNVEGALSLVNLYLRRNTGNGISMGGRGIQDMFKDMRDVLSGKKTIIDVESDEDKDKEDSTNAVMCQGITCGGKMTINNNGNTVVMAMNSPIETSATCYVLMDDTLPLGVFYSLLDAKKFVDPDVTITWTLNLKDGVYFVRGNEWKIHKMKLM